MKSWIRQVNARAVLAVVTAIGAVLLPCATEAASYNWIGPTNANWNNPANWERTDGPAGGFPNGVGDNAVFPGAILTDRTIAIPTGQTITVGAILCTATVAITIKAGSDAALVLDAGPGSSVQLQSNFNAFVTLEVPLRLQGGLLVHVGPGGDVRVSGSITESGGSRAIAKTGTGVLRFAAPNAATGVTTVKEGSLALQSTTGPSITGALLIGEGIGGPQSARVIVAQSDQIADAASVTVHADGLLQLTEPDILADLNVRDGTVVTELASLTMRRLTMTGGILAIANGGFFRLDGPLIASSSALGRALIRRNATAGTLSLLGTTRTFTVNDGPQAVDLEIALPIIGTGSAGLVKDGPGTLRFSGPTGNAYPGETLVQRGRLELARENAVGVLGNLRVGAGAGPAVVQFVLSQNIAAAATIFVGPEGVLSCGSTTTEIAGLIVGAGGGVEVGAATGPGALVVGASAAITGGRIALTRDSALTLSRLTATSTAAQPAAIDGEGTVRFAATPPPTTLTMVDGPQAIDLRIAAAMQNQFLTVNGAGVAQFAGANSSITATTVAGPTVLVTSTQSDPLIVLTSGTLGGTGTVGSVIASAGRLAPGLSPGRLTSGTVTLTSATTFAVELNGTTPGVDHDQLTVRGGVNLGNASLSVAVRAALGPNARLTIIDNDGTDPVVGTFAGFPEGTTASIDGQVLTISYIGGTGNDVVLTTPSDPDKPPTPTAINYFLAEGATGSFFDDDVLLVNPNSAEAPVTLTFLQETGQTIVDRRTLAAQSRMTVHVDEIPGLESTTVSVQVTSDKGLPLVVERSMFWDASYYGGHTATAVAQPEKRWMFAEGAQGFFDTYVLIANVTAEETTATVTYLRENEPPVVQTVPIAPFARKTIYAGDVPELITRAFGIVVEAPLPVVAERAMYFATIPGRLWTGGHVNNGAAEPSTVWFHAEGATGFFHTFILLTNPQETEARVEVRFLLDTGEVITRQKRIEAKHRLTIDPADEGDPRLASAAISTIVQSDVPIVSERSMYWPGDATPIGEGHNSLGVVSAGMHWGLAEGRLGGPHVFDTFILLANPSPVPAEVTITYLREAGEAIVRTYTVPATSRFNVDVKTVVPELLDSSFGARIDVTNNVPIAVERSLYWNANGVLWAGGTNAVATPIP